LSNGIEHDAACQQLRQNVATAIRVAGEHDVDWGTGTTDSVQCACNLRIVASPINAQQNVMPPNEFLLADRLEHQEGESEEKTIADP
jgi:hypothetical protein